MKTVKVFISSTFKDMNAERDVLIKNVFPRLREKAEPIGIRIQEIDLRWGVTEEEVKKGEVLDLCLDGIEECKPYFICMLGRRYGWIPAPVYILKDEFISIISNIQLESDEVDLLKKAYFLENEGKVYKLEVSLSNEEKDLIQRILDKTGLKEAGMSITAQEIDYIMSESAIPNTIQGLDKLLSDGVRKTLITNSDSEFILSFYYLHYGSEQIWRIQPGITAEEKGRILDIFNRIGYHRNYHRFFFVREEKGDGFYSIDDKNTMADEYIDTEEIKARKLEMLKSSIRASGKYDVFNRYPCTWNSDNTGKEGEGIYPITGLEQFEEMLFNSLWNHMRDNPELRQGSEKKKTFIEEENEAHLKFIDSRTYNFRGRKDLLGDLENAVDSALAGELAGEGGKTRTIMVVGEPGSGKSALLAQFYNIYAEKHDDYLIIPRFIGGGSGRSTNPRNLLTDFCTILIKAFDIKEEVKDEKGGVISKKKPEIPIDTAELEKAFISNLGKAPAKVVIILDAINQLQKEGRAREMMWFPADIPVNACVVTSIAVCSTKLSETKETEEDENILESLRKRGKPYEIEMKNLSIDEKKEIIYSYLWQFNKKLKDELVTSIAGKREASHPLYLQIALEELRLLSRHDELEKFVTVNMPETSGEMFEYILKRHEIELERRLGSNLFRNFMLFLATGRNGMTEEDLRLLMGEWSNLREIGKAQARLSDFHWGELRRAMRPYLVQRGEEWDFFHIQLKQAVVGRYLCSEEKGARIHKDVANYLETMGYGHKTTLGELPYHRRKSAEYFGSTEWSNLERVLSDLSFIESKFAAGMIFGIMEDYRIQKAENNITHYTECLLDFEEFVHTQAHLLSKYPFLTLQQAANGPENSSPMTKALPVLIKRRKPWIRLLNKSVETRIGYTALAGHEQEVTACNYSTDGKMIITAGGNKIKLWDTETCLELLSIEGHTDKVLDCSFSPDNMKMVSCSRDKTIKIWDVKTGLLLSILIGHKDSVVCCEFSPDGKWILSASSDSNIKIWDSYTGIEIYNLSGHTKGVTHCEFSPDGRTIVSCSPDKTLKIWDIDKRKLLKTYNTANEVVLCRYSPNGTHILCKEVDYKLPPLVIGVLPKSSNFQIFNRISCLDSISDKTIHITKSNKELRDCKWSPDASKIIVCTDKNFMVFDTQKNYSSQAFIKNSDITSSFSISPDGNRLISGYFDGSLNEWDFSSDAVLENAYHSSRVVGCIFIDENHALSGDTDGMIIKWVDCKGTIMVYSNDEYYKVNKWTFSFDGLFAIAACTDNILRVWKVKEGCRIFELSGHSQKVDFFGNKEEITDCDFAPNSYICVSSSEDGTLKLWDALKGIEIGSFAGHNDAFDFNAVTPSLKYIPSRSHVVNGCCFSTNGKQVLSCGNDGRIKLWDTSDFSELAVFDSKMSVAANCVFFGYGYYIACWGNNDSVKIIEKRTGLLYSMFEKKEIYFCSFSPDNRLILLCTQEPMLELWDTSNWKMISAYKSIGKATMAAWYSDSRKLMVGDATGRIYFFEIPNYFLKKNVKYGYDGFILNLRNKKPINSRMNNVSSWHNSNIIRVNTSGIDINLRMNNGGGQNSEAVPRDLNNAEIAGMGQKNNQVTTSEADKKITPKSKAENEIKLLVQYQRDLRKWNALPFWKKAFIKKPERPDEK